MNTTPELVARQLDADSLGIPRNFITTAIVADAMRAQPGRFGYLVCDFPSSAQQSLIHTLALARRAMRSVDGFPCPEPRLAHMPFDGLYRDCVSMGFRRIIDAWDGFTAAGDVMAAGVDYGKFWRLDDPRPILPANACDRCGSEAEFRDRSTGDSLCPSCYESTFSDAIAAVG